MHSRTLIPAVFKNNYANLKAMLKTITEYSWDITSDVTVCSKLKQNAVPNVQVVSHNNLNKYLHQIGFSRMSAVLLVQEPYILAGVFY